jgi:hypothetical protein
VLRELCQCEAAVVAGQAPKSVGTPTPCLRKVACGLRQLRVGEEYSDKRSNRRIPRVFEGDVTLTLT